MFTRDNFQPNQWLAIRNTPHHVVVAVSAAGDGTLIDDMLERKAGLQAIVDAMNSTNPLLREIADSTQIMAAQTEIRSWYYTLEEPSRTPQTLRQKALESMHHALDALDQHGTPEDLLQYADFVLATAFKVARAAREGDVLGVGGEIVSPPEHEFLEALQTAAARAR